MPRTPEDREWEAVRDRIARAAGRPRLSQRLATLDVHVAPPPPLALRREAPACRVVETARAA